MKEATNISDEKRPLASIPLQTFLYFDYIFTVYKSYSYLVHLFHNRNNCLYLQRLWFILSSKQNRNRNIFAVSISILPISSIDIRINRQQNRISILNFMVLGYFYFRFVLLIFPCIFFYIFFIVLQTYVVILEIIINVIGLIFIIFELLFSLSAFLTFKNYEKQQ
ncbi:unnamed protein product (macronuclear) [Paramecium tetraurelia]|uniref:Transmembrane protein n=1 Tax=Paramecium tetraurelia TaxID=5888 RepID=A0C5H9_PARTE|nr:uncharacterized protein GSPATT00006545001 [Paramecium tetraurelia]CAK66046.1 unnamed protein product [Paramecium tetraurelia]|eukprot:XP_001433443.1 hypothetical protein (macronuclear) [Paramecium tetraurelia strain d4-2]